MDNNFGWNLGGDFIAHYGTKRHSGRYPWGSGAKNGKAPIHEHGEKKHKGGSHHTSLSPENQKLFDLAKSEDKWHLEFLEKTQNLEGITRKQLLGEYGKYLKDPKSYKAPADDHYNRSSNNSQEDADTKARKAAQAAGLDQGDNWKMYRMAQAGDERAKKVIEEWEEKYGKNNGKLKIPTEPLYETKTTGGLFNKRKETVLSEAGKKWQSEVADKTKSYYDNMDENDLNARVKAFEKWKKAREEYEEEPSRETYQKEAIASNALNKLVRNDGNKILGTGSTWGEVKPGENLYGNYKDNHKAYILGWVTFDGEMYNILNKKRHVSHSELDPDNIVRILNTPI